jgi:hypothetical protein
MYYVSPSGDDSGNGSIQAPWRTIEYGLEEIQPGDTLFLRDGIYHEPISISKSGTNQNPITIRNYPGENPIIDVANQNNGIIGSGSYWNIIGLEVRNCNENGIWIESSQYFTIINCTIRDVQYGIGIADGSHDFKVENCIITDFTLYGFDASPSGGLDCYNGLIQDCIAYSGSDHQQNVDGFAVGHGDQTGFTFINCTTLDVYDGFDISSDDTLLLGCLSAGCWNAGYKIWGDNVTLINCIGFDSNTNLELDWSGTSKNVFIYHSDFVQSETFNLWIEDKRDTVHVYNSIIVGGNNIGICFENGYSDSYRGDYNLFHNWNSERMVSFTYEEEYSMEDFQDMTWSGQTEQDTNSIIVDDLTGIFVGLSEMNLYPADGSPLIDAGDSSKRVGLDFDFYPRSDANPPDIGAYEYSADRDIRVLKYEIPQYQEEQVIDEDIQFESNNQVLYVVTLAIIVIVVYIIAKRMRRL